MSRTKVWASGLCAQFSLYVDPLLKKNSFQERILVAQHQAFIGSMTMSGLQVGQVLLMSSDGFFKLLDVLSAALTESCLSLAVPLLALLRGRIDLPTMLAHASGGISFF